MSNNNCRNNVKTIIMKLLFVKYKLSDLGEQFYLVNWKFKIKLFKHQN